MAQQTDSALQGGCVEVYTLVLNHVVLMRPAAVATDLLDDVVHHSVPQLEFVLHLGNSIDIALQHEFFLVSFILKMTSPCTDFLVVSTH